PFILFLLKETTDYPGYEDWWYASPGHALYRFSAVVLSFCVLYLVQERITKSRIAPVLQLCGQESLFFYIFHLMLVYGSIANFGLMYLASYRYNVFEVLLVYIAITGTTYSLASMWHSYKKTEPQKSSRLVFWLMALFMTVYALVPSYLSFK
ncbi:MAG: hypothetical protein JNL32_16555, partial [Candidatus Kapabacteria bacterium]|nr:hypothetical protein [Candidatus Kapabacteria bacterium]